MILFTRVPEPGKTKTRLMPYLGPEGCAALHECFIRDIAGRLRGVDADLFVCYEPSGDPDILRPMCGEDAVYFPQSGEGLGKRMENAFLEVLGRGYDSCVLMGTDIPEMRREDIEKSFDVLERCDAVIGPSEDGGYWLIGMREVMGPLFEGKTYGHGSVLADLEHTMKDLGLTYDMTSAREDMDVREDLASYRSRMRSDSRLRKSCTGRFLRDNMSISVIVPVYNEERMIDRMLSQLRPLREDCEVILVDGGSTDGTIGKIPDDWHLISSPKGRGVQMNAGAGEATGDVLFFLHCDSELPEDPLKEIRRVMSRREAGCFGIAFHSKQFFMWTCRVMSNHRAKARGIMFGDQGIFVTRELFFRLGGYAEIPVMEDYQFSMDMKSMGIRPGMCRRRIYTSERRYPARTIPKLQFYLRMRLLRRAYRKGTPAGLISKQYRDVR